jgi:hypothetical protein
MVAKASVGLFAVLMFAALQGCMEGNLAACRNDNNCKGGAKAHCVNSICAECRGEDDCPSPLICGRDHTCKSLTLNHSTRSRVSQR